MHRVYRAQCVSWASECASNWQSCRLQSLGVCMMASITSLSLLEHWRGCSGRAASVGLAIASVLPMANAFSSLLSSLATTEQEAISIERVREYIDDIQHEHDVLLPNNAMNERNDLHDDAVSAVSAVSVDDKWPQCGHIEFRDVSMRYKETAELVLHHVCLHIQHGDKVAIIGRTGSGKSSILQILTALRNCE